MPTERAHAHVHALVRARNPSEAPIYCATHPSTRFFCSPAGASAHPSTHEGGAAAHTRHSPVSERDAPQASLCENPHNAEGWNKLVRLVEDSGDPEEIKEAYESLLKMYPNTWSAQIAYLDHFIVPGRFRFAEDHLYTQFLRTSPALPTFGGSTSPYSPIRQPTRAPHGWGQSMNLCGTHQARTRTRTHAQPI